MNLFICILWSSEYFQILFLILFPYIQISFPKIAFWLIRHFIKHKYLTLNTFHFLSNWLMTSVFVSIFNFDLFMSSNFQAFTFVVYLLKPTQTFFPLDCTISLKLNDKYLKKQNWLIRHSMTSWDQLIDFTKGRKKNFFFFYGSNIPVLSFPERLLERTSTGLLHHVEVTGM